MVICLLGGNEVDKTLKGHIDFLLVFAHVKSRGFDYQLVLIFDIDEPVFLL